MTAKQELIEYIKNLTPEQVEKVISRLPLLRQCLEMNDYAVRYTQAFNAKLWGLNGGASE